MEQDEIQDVIEENSISVEDRPEEGLDEDIGGLPSFLQSQYTRARSSRYSDEQRWLKAYRNYRGIYGPDVQFTEAEKSRVFVKVTKTKVLAAYGQVSDVILGSGKFPLGISPTTLPEGISGAVHFDTTGASESPADSLQPGDTLSSLRKRLGPLEKKLEPVKGKIKQGEGTAPGQITFHPAAEAAAKMEKKIHDQLEESEASKKLRHFTFDMCLYGTGIMQGPFTVNKEYPFWSDQGVYEPKVIVRPSLDYVSIWDFYPDPDANRMEEAEYVFRRHKMTRSQLRSLKKRPHFRSNAVDVAIEYGANYVEEWWETQLEAEESSNNPTPNRFEVLQFWGMVDREHLEELNVTIPEGLDDQDEFQVNAWMCNNEILRLVLNPFQPVRIPFHAAPYEINPHSFFGIGVAENMEDTQILMNGFMRMAVDNGALSGNLLIEIDETNLAPGQDMSIYPGKVFRREGGAPGQAIFGTKFPNVSNENMQMFDKARQLADESTGLPSFAHGQTGVTGVGRTSSGISMLMSAANGSIRTVVKNIDDYLLMPLGTALYHFNHQFDFDKELTGDLEVKARGTESLMADEVRSQRLMQFLSIVQTPILAPFAKMDYIVREIAKSMDLDEDRVVNNMSDAALQAEILRKLTETQTPAEPGTTEGAPAVPSPANTAGTGNGNIGVGQAPVPQEQGFSGNI